MRETKTWQQPLIERNHIEHCVLLFVIQNGVAYFNVVAYPEIGFKKGAQFGPSLQTGEGPLKVDMEVLTRRLEKNDILVRIEQSDEGGRFYQVITQYVVGRWTGDIGELNQENSIWLSCAELEQLSLKKGILTNELRTLLSLLLSFA